MSDKTFVKCTYLWLSFYFVHKRPHSVWQGEAYSPGQRICSPRPWLLLLNSEQTLFLFALKPSSCSKLPPLSSFLFLKTIRLTISHRACRLSEEQQRSPEAQPLREFQQFSVSFSTAQFPNREESTARLTEIFSLRLFPWSYLECFSVFTFSFWISFLLLSFSFIF